VFFPERTCANAREVKVLLKTTKTVELVRKVKQNRIETCFQYFNQVKKYIKKSTYKKIFE